jgi:hypothetical protein
MNTPQSKALWLGRYLNLTFVSLVSGKDPQDADMLKLKRLMDGFAASLGLRVEIPRVSDVKNVVDVNNAFTELRETTKLDIAVVSTEFVSSCYLFGHDFSAWMALRGGYKEVNLDAATVEAKILDQARELGLQAEFNDCIAAAKNPALSREQFNNYAGEEVLLRMTAKLDASAPVFASKRAASNRLFIVMPMFEEDPGLPDVLDTIKDTAQRLGINAVRIDEFDSSGRITDNLVEGLKTAAFVVVDLTHSRPNVYWEAGYTHGLGKTPIYIARKGTNLAFDIKDYPVIYFSTYRELRELLGKRLKAMQAL